MVFQDPYSSLNNRQTVETIIAEPIRFYGLAKDKKTIRQLVASVLDLVEMPQRAMLKYPHQFSGGQRQRIAVARALVARPDFLICDEPTSALDVSIQAQILNLLKDLQAEFGLSILFISHNLAVIRQMADRVIVLKRGELVEAAETEAFFEEPQAAYSQLLLSETPSLSLIESNTD
jgi:peptide/nickel transport system ATP-binding protein